MRSCTAAIGLLLCSMLLTGCWDRIEINDLAIILATGVDYVDEKVELTAQIYVPRKAGGGPESGSQGSSSGATIIRTAEGRTVAEAFNRLQRKMARNMFWGHCEVIVISEEAGKRGLREYIEFFLRYPQFREHAYIFSSREPAKDVLALLDPLERSSAEALREMANMGLGVRVTLLELGKSIEGPSHSAILTRMLILPSEPGQNPLASSPYVRGLSLYKDGRYVETVNEPLSVGVLLLANELNNIIMPVGMKSREGSISIRPTEIKATLTPRIVNKEWSMQIRIHSKGEVVLNTTDANLTDPSKLAELEKAWSDKLKQLANQALEMSQKQLKADLFKFSVTFRNHYPKQWKEQQINWEAIFQDMKVEVKVKAYIIRTGKSTGPQGIPGQSTH